MSDAIVRELQRRVAALERKLERQALISAQAVGLATALAQVLSREFPAARIHLEAALTEAALAAEGDAITLELLRKVSQAMANRTT